MLLRYIYGTIELEDLLEHHSSLICAAEKHNIRGLKELCDQILMEDINKGNVIARRKEA